MNTKVETAIVTNVVHSDIINISFVEFNATSVLPGAARVFLGAAQLPSDCAAIAQSILSVTSISTPLRPHTIPISTSQALLFQKHVDGFYADVFTTTLPEP